jgi:hypothetical protein
VSLDCFIDSTHLSMSKASTGFDPLISEKNDIKQDSDNGERY